MDLAERLKERLSILPNFFDEIRIVDPLSKRVIKVDDETGEIIEESGICYHLISESEVCQNCISYRSMLHDDTFVKIERIKEQDSIRVISTPIKIGEKTFIAEIIRKVDYSIIGNEEFNANENVRIIMDDMNRKIVTDELTGLYNRRFIDERINVDIFNQKRNKKLYTMVMADIDYFKEINDTYGHLAGDMVLKGAAELIAKTVGKLSGWIGRYGGEEFIFVYYDKPFDEVIENIEDLRKSLEEKEFTYNGTKIKITSSFGVAELSEKHKNGRDLLKCADDMLYNAKENGRNRIEYMNKN
ncbi:MAG: GGDEF domain-containing protein [Clostridium sp.]|nr:GGDEF domain-containing protein [Clostridium sp.]